MCAKSLFFGVLGTLLIVSLARAEVPASGGGGGQKAGSNHKEAKDKKPKKNSKKAAPKLAPVAPVMVGPRRNPGAGQSQPGRSDPGITPATPGADLSGPTSGSDDSTPASSKTDLGKPDAAKSDAGNTDPDKADADKDDADKSAGSADASPAKKLREIEDALIAKEGESSKVAVARHIYDKAAKKLDAQLQRVLGSDLYRESLEQLGGEPDTERLLRAKLLKDDTAYQKALEDFDYAKSRYDTLREEVFGKDPQWKAAVEAVRAAAKSTMTEDAAGANS